jgi:hypothetical protein
VTTTPARSLRLILAATPLFLYAGMAAAQTLTGGSGMYVTGSCGGASCVQNGGIAEQSDMQAGFGDIASAISQVAGALNLGQETQSTAMGQIGGQVNATITNAERQAAVADMEDSIQAAQPVDKNGNQTRVAAACTFTSSSGASLGALSGDIAAATAADAIQSSLESYNTGSAGQPQPYINRLAALTAQDMDPSNVLGSPDGSGGNTHYDPDQVRSFIATVTNPIPLSALPSALNTTPDGKKYAALSSVQHAGMDIPQETLTGISQMNAPLFRVQAWADQQISTLAGSNSQLASGLESQLASGAQNGAISENSFLYTMNALRLANPQWWTEINSSPSNLALEQQIVEMDAVRVDIAYRNLVLTERQAAMLAIQTAQQTNDTIGATAQALRNDALAAATTRAGSGASQ